jgi:hypothetical protein
LFLAACGGAANLPHHAPGGREPTRLVVDADAAARHALRAERLDIPFGQRENGTRLVLALMEEAQARGAAWVGVEFLQVFKHRGELIECATPLARPGTREPEPAATAPPPAPTSDGTPVYTTTVAPPRPQKLGATVSEDVVTCARHGQSRLASERAYPGHWDVEAGRSRARIPIEKKLHVDWQDECRLEHVTHHVERWDFQLRLEWTPPDWQLIAPRWAEEPLVDGTPTCYRVTAADIGEPPRHRLRAHLFYRSKFRDSGVVPLTPLETVGRDF